MTTTDETTAAATAPRATLLDKTVCLVLHKRKFGNRRKASIAHVQTQADKALLGLSKKLLDSDELKAINAVDGELSGFIESICMPSMFKSGVHLVAIPLVERVEDELRKFQVKRQQAIEAFLAVYPERVQEIETRLNDQFDARNYPNALQMREQFSLDWQYVTFGVPGSLKAIKASLFEEERAKYATKLQEATDTYRDTLRARLLTFVDKMRGQLKTDADGKRKRIYEGQVEQLTNALKLFELQDATEDTDLKPIIEQARAVMSGVDIEQLRDDDAFRARIEQGLDSVAAALQVLTEDRHSRDIEIDADDAATA